MYGALAPRLENGCAVTSLGYHLGKNSEVFTKGDLIEVASGIAEVADDTAARAIGIANRTVTMASDNQTVAKVEIDYTPLNENVLFEMDFDAAAAVADQNAFYTITGATGAQQVSYASKDAGVGQVQLVKLDPRGEGSTTRGLRS